MPQLKRQAYVSLNVRVDMRTDRLRRKLQRQLDVSAPVLLGRALDLLAADIAEKHPGPDEVEAAA
jgi:hypothetical protein